MTDAVLDFPFVQDLPKREAKAVRSNWEQFKEMATVIERVGALVPPAFAADLLGLSTQRVAQLQADGRFETFRFCGRQFVCERDLITWAEQEHKNGRPFKELSAKQLWAAARRESKRK